MSNNQQPPQNPPGNVPQQGRAPSRSGTAESLPPSQSHRGHGGRRGEGRGHRQHSESKSKRVKELHTCRRRKLILKLLVILLLLGQVGTVVYFKMKGGTDTKKSRDVAVKLHHQTKEFKVIQAEVAELRKNMDSLVQGRMPGLLKLVYDTVISVDERYVKNVIFTLSKKGLEKTYGFNLTLHNKESSVVEPRLAIYLFNDTGLQIGHGVLDGMNDQVLIPDEQRSFNSTVELTLKGEPAYFMIHLEKTGD